MCSPIATAIFVGGFGNLATIVIFVTFGEIGLVFSVFQKTIWLEKIHANLGLFRHPCPTLTYNAVYKQRYIGYIYL